MAVFMIVLSPFNLWAQDDPIHVTTFNELSVAFQSGKTSIIFDNDIDGGENLVTLGDGRTVVVDFDNHKLTYQSWFFVVKNSSSLTLKNGTIEGCVNAPCVEARQSTVSIENLTYTGTNGFIFLDGSTLNVGSDSNLSCNTASTYLINDARESNTINLQGPCVFTNNSFDGHTYLIFSGSSPINCLSGYKIVDANDKDVNTTRDAYYWTQNSPTLKVIEKDRCKNGHTLAPVEAQNPTCVADGNIAHYHCTVCGSNFSDELGENPISTVVIPALGHDIDDNAHCTRCEYVVPDLSVGENICNIPVTPYDKDDVFDYSNPHHFALFRFVATENGSLTVSSVGDEDTYGVLYNADFSDVLGFNDDGDDGDDENYNFLLTYDGVKAGKTYWVGVREYGGDAISDYTINVSFEPIPSLVVGDNLLPTIDAVTIDDDNCDDAESFNLYSFRANATGKMTVYANGEGDSYGALFDADQQFLMSDDDGYNNGQSSDFRLICDVTEGENYYIGVREYKGRDLTDYTVSIVIEKPIAECTILDGEEYCRNSVDVAQLTYKRTVSESQVGKWQALYVPFQMTCDDLNAADFDVAAINNFHEYTDEDGNVTKTELEVRYAKNVRLKANHPYLVRPKTAGEKTIVLNDVVLAPSDERRIYCSSVDREYCFTGTYVAMQDLLSEGYAFLSDGMLCDAANDTQTLKPQRWYLSISDNDSQFDDDGVGGESQARSIAIHVIGDDETTPTGLDEIFVMTSKASDATSAEVIYDLQGRRLPAASKGFNIVRQRNGEVKKVLVK